jgi:hypothetical protein
VKPFGFFTSYPQAPASLKSILPIKETSAISMDILHIATAGLVLSTFLAGGLVWIVLGVLQISISFIYRLQGAQERGQLSPWRL